MPKNINICSSWHGNANEDFNFVNQNTVQGIVAAVPGQTWPFVQSSPITVPAKDGGPGSTACQLLPNLADGTYTYDVTGCITGGQPRNVTIP